MNFSLSREQIAKFVAWRDSPELHPKCAGVESKTAIGGAITFSFTPTTIGTVVTAECCVCNNKVDLSDYDSW